MHLLGDLVAMRRFKRPQIVLGLRVQPKPRAIAEVKPETQCRIRRYSAFAVEDIHDPTGRNPKRDRQTVGAKLARGQFAFQQPSGMRRYAHSLFVAAIHNVPLSGSS